VYSLALVLSRRLATTLCAATHHRTRPLPTPTDLLDLIHQVVLGVEQAPIRQRASHPIATSHHHTFFLGASRFAKQSTHQRPLPCGVKLDASAETMPQPEHPYHVVGFTG
jgi:hypothetical protein